MRETVDSFHSPLGAFSANRKEILERFGERLRDLRVEARKSPSDLAFDLGITATQLEEIENGTKDVDLVLLQKIAIALDLTFERLFDQI